ncbi:MAG TPA: ABC transporter ATP-binding protein [Nitrospirae bacterium]|nr:hemin import ATP-binding protein HmuV [bacterium BMS3Bbin09]HDN95344.1 ABC transporter ATP-binding protein [Nitrospirota bacterium]HDY71108.1 ABC transporter ATP-binding protein [Nitrospirota bacterium]
MVAVLGNNGSGKSTFLNVLSGQMDFTGDYRVGNRKFQEISQQECARRIGFLPQEAALNMPFDAFYVVLTGRFIHSDGRMYSEQDVIYTEKAMKTFDVFHLKDRLFNALSGGEKQRVLLARVMNMDTDIFLLDEPFSGIDILHQIKVVDIFKRLQREKIIMVVIHDLSFAIHHFSRFLFFREGLLLYDMGRNELDPEKLSDIFGVRVGFVEQNKRMFVYTEEI